MSELVGLLEVVGLFGLVMGFAVWEIRKTNRSIHRRRDDEDRS